MSTFLCFFNKSALKCLEELIINGLDAKNFLNDILEVLYLFSKNISLGNVKSDISISENEAKLIELYSENINIQDIGLFWQLTIKTLEDLQIVGNENLTLEMYIMQLVHLKNIGINNELTDDSKKMTSKENLPEKKIENKPSETIRSNQIKSQLKSTDQIKTNPIKNLSNQNLKSKLDITNFQDLIKKAEKEKEIELKFDLERNVKLVSFNRGKIDISFNEQLNKNFIKNLTEKLLLWTGERWIITLSKNLDAKSIYEKNIEDKSNLIREFKKSNIFQEIEKAFPDAELTDLESGNND